MPESVNGAVRPPLAKWSLAMIVRNCAAELERCLKTIAAYPDEIVIVNTGLSADEEGFKATNDVARSFGAKIFHFPWIKDFAAARNFSFEKCSNDVVMWLDTDDMVDNPMMLDRFIRRNFAEGRAQVLYLEYLYAFDSIEFDGKKPVKWGTCTAVLTRERIVDRRAYLWESPVHEILCEKFKVTGFKVPPNMGRIRHVHLHDEESMNGALERNLGILEYHYGPTEKGGLGKYCEERMLYYWANSLMGLKRYEEALPKYLEYIPRSGAPAEIVQALLAASECARAMGNLGAAKALAHQANDRNPNAPTSYWMLAQAHKAEGNEALAEHYALQCLEHATSIQQEMIANPKIIFGGSALLAATCKFRQNKLDEVEPLLKIAERYYAPETEDIVEMRTKIEEARRHGAIMQSYLTIMGLVEQESGIEGLRALAVAAPKEIKGAAEVARFLPKHRPLTKRSVAFLCGGGMPGKWGPALLKTGIGGSEEAVCYLSEQLALKGWHVEVYASCDRQTWNGVEWYPFSEFAGSADADKLDVLVVWRSPYLMRELGTTARTKYVWLHDMPTPGLWYQGSWNDFNGIFCLSEFHRGVYDFIPEEKKILSANGIPLDRLVPMDQLANEPHRMVYASDPIRGLETVLLWWEQIRKAVPDAELDVYYGFHPTLMAACRGRDPYSRQLSASVQRIDKLRAQPGVNWLGFVGHEVLHKGFAKAGIWLYPTVFPEISCITAMKMQAHGVVPVTSTMAALAETVHHGVKVPGDMLDPLAQRAWFEEVVRQAQSPWTREQRVEMALDARARFSWEKVADQWINVFETSLNGTANERHIQQPRAELIAQH